MTHVANLTASRTSDSTDRTPALAGTRTSGPAGHPKTAATRVGGTARRLLSALMRSLATPHV